MEDNIGIEEITRREALRLGASSVLAVATFASFPNLSWADSAEEELQSYRRKLFGRWPFLKDGDLERLEFKLYKKDKRQFDEIVTEAIRFIKGKNRELYQKVYGQEGRVKWEKDKNKAKIFLLKNINVPDYFIHRKIRDILRENGILDFQAHQREIEKSLDTFIKQHNAAGGIYKETLYQAITQMVEKAEGLKHVYLATLPIYDETALKKIEKQRKRLIRKAPDLMDNVRNIAEAEKTKNYLKLGHQMKELIFGFNDIYENDLPEILRIALEYGKIQSGLGHRYKKLFLEPDKFIYVPDYIDQEFDRLNFSNWEKRLKKKLDNLK